MAILFRIRLLFALRLLILNGSILSAEAYVNLDRVCPISLSPQNPDTVVGGALKNSLVFLHCNVSTDVDEGLTKDLSIRHFYAPESENEDEDEDDEGYNYDPDEVRRLYQQQREKHNKETANNRPDAVITTNSQLQKRNHNANKKAGNDNTIYGNSIRRSRRESTPPPLISYEWLRNDNSFLSINSSNQEVATGGYTLYPNGTLKFQVSSVTTGVYRCRATYRNRLHQFAVGPILSTASRVELASLTSDASEKRPASVAEGHSVVVVCPISSNPAATFAWTFNDERISFDVGVKERRHFLLRNGSLLIVNSRHSDSGKYLCNAANQFTKKPWQNSTILTVVSRSNNGEDGEEARRGALLPQLQDSQLKIKSGQILVLHCASNDTRKISWTFAPRNANQSIPLGEFNNELRYVNVSVEKHDGIYNCSTESGSQTFDVVIMTRPAIVSSQKSKSSQVIGSIQFNCSAIGNPRPEITWYKDGELIENSHLRHARDEILRIETLELHDEGLYQCLARNDYGEASGTFYLHLAPRIMLNDAPTKAKCFSTGDNTLTIEFQRSESERVNRIQYFIVTEEPHNFYTSITTDLLGHSSFELPKNATKIAKTLKPFYIYMRAMMPSGYSMTMSPLSKPLACAYQEIEPRFVKAQNGTFLTWQIADLSREELDKAVITIQFLKNDTGNVMQFGSEAVGTYARWQEETPQWREVEKALQKISVNSADRGEWTEIKVTGNVTGILIIKIEEIFVRIFGSFEESGEYMQQNFSQVKWKSVKTTFAPLAVSKIESRSATISWSGLDDATCLRACTYLKQEALVTIRGSKVSTHCERINDPSAKNFYIRGLLPMSNYDVYIKDCEENYASSVANFQTLRDVPGPVDGSYFDVDKEHSSLILRWEPPKNANGKIFHYIVTWTINNVTHEENATELSFRFPNAKPDDKFYIVVRAVGEGGVGNPLIIDPQRSKMYETVPMLPPMQQTSSSNQLAIVLIMVVCVVLTIVLALLVLCRRYRYCKKSNGIISNEQQSSFSPTTSPVMDTMKSDEMYEMQTLIPASQNSGTLTNGRENNAKGENLSNGGGGVLSSGAESQNILRTSTPTEELTTMTEICDEPPIKCDAEATIQISDERKPNGLLKTFQAMAPAIVSSKTPEKGLLKVGNGSSSPYKCLQSSVNDQNSSSESSSFGSNHRQQLIDINSLCSGLNNNTIHNNNINNNSNHHHNNSNSDRSRIGKSSSIETDNDDEDSEENLHEYDLNDSNLSTKPLHPISGWNFRQQIVEPNG